jgi:hypothetical protein
MRNDGRATGHPQPFAPKEWLRRLAAFIWEWMGEYFQASQPMQKLAKEYGISDVGLAKVCKKLYVPLPGRGYWAKKAAGKTLERKPRLEPVTVL